MFDSVAVSCQMADVPERKRTGQWTADRVRLWDWTSVSVSLCLFLEFLRIRFLNLKFPFFVIGIWSSVQRRVLVLDSSASTLDFLAFSCAGDFFLCLPVCPFNSRRLPCAALSVRARCVDKEIRKRRLNRIKKADDQEQVAAPRDETKPPSRQMSEWTGGDEREQKRRRWREGGERETLEPNAVCLIEAPAKSPRRRSRALTTSDSLRPWSLAFAFR